MAQVLITLNVDAANITELNKNTACSLTGATTTTPDTDNITHAVTEAYVDDTVVWTGVDTSNENAVITINEIVHDSGINAFSSGTLTGNMAGDVEGIAANETNNNKYTINFLVGTTAYSIDPKIRVHAPH